MSKTCLVTAVASLVAWQAAFGQCEQAKLTPSDYSYRFGGTVSIAADVAVVGAWGTPPPPGLGYGGPASSPVDGAAPEGILDAAAYVFRREGANWVEEAKLNGSDQTMGDSLAGSVCIFGDVVMVGAPMKVQQCPDGLCYSGVVYVFRRVANVWVEDAILTPSDAVQTRKFGVAVALSGDLAIIGASRDSTPCPDGEYTCGSAYVFRREGATWVEEAKLTPSDPGDNAAFGSSVAITGDVVVVGAPGWNPEAGSAYVFRPEGATWVEEAKLAPSDIHEGDRFGSSVDVDDGIIVVGARLYDVGGIRTGSAYVFSLDGTSWVEEAMLTPSDGDYGDSFGHSVSISGEVIAVGAVGDDDGCPAELVCNSGAAYLFNRVGDAWFEGAKLTPGDAATRDEFGTVAIHGNDVLVGAREADVVGPNSGAAYVFSVSKCVIRVPCVSQWGLVIMVGLALTAGSVIIKRRGRVLHKV